MRRPTPGRTAVVAALVVSVFALLLGRLGQVQVIAPVAYAGPAAVSLDTRTTVQPAVRGRILDAQGQPLTDNTSSVAVTLERRVLVEATDGGRGLVDRIAKALDRPAQALWERTFLCGSPGATPPPACFNGSAYQPIPIAEHVDPTAALSLLEQPENYPGVGVEAQPGRGYPAPDGVNAAHLLGYVDRATAADVGGSAGAVTAEESVGRDGLEAQYDGVLRGTHGTTTVAVDPRGVVVDRLATTAPVAGRDVVTHISAPVQAAAERALAAAVGTARRGGFTADSGAAVVLDVTNGAVVAAASYPAYDPNVWTGGISQANLDALRNPAAGTPLVSRVTGATMPPASTFKIVSTTAAAAMGVDLGGRYDCSSTFQVGDRAFANYESHDYGVLTLQRNLEVSCDTIWYRFAYQSWLAQGGLAAKDDAADPFVTAAKGYGLGVRTGVDLPGEVDGRVPDRAWKRSTWEDTKEQSCARAQTGYPDVWAADPGRADYLKALAVENCDSGWQYRAGDAANFSIGQGDIAVTPLQLARAYAAVANGGTLWVPQVAAATQNQDGTARTPITPVAAGRAPLTPQVHDFLVQALQGVITAGTASGVFAGWPQADYPLAGKTGSAEVFGKQATSWFASFGPVTNPRYAVVVMVAQAGTGASTAAPASRAIWEALRATG
ncbi:MAG TPA: penicillin-binding transpeptidase domain-containing protein [Lapillicoccus sp.]|nr:penicillin-binding transpeptidase domain-containing protein [Lapillicoccus sp.]